jgi:hypothetical protein
VKCMMAKHAGDGSFGWGWGSQENCICMSFRGLIAVRNTAGGASKRSGFMLCTFLVVDISLHSTEFTQGNQNLSCGSWGYLIKSIPFLVSITRAKETV